MMREARAEVARGTGGVVARSCAAAGRSARVGVVISLGGAVGQSWVAANRSTKGGAGVPLGAPTTRKSSEGAPENVKDV